MASRSRTVGNWNAITLYEKQRQRARLKIRLSGIGIPLKYGGSTLRAYLVGITHLSWARRDQEYSE